MPVFLIRIGNGHLCQSMFAGQEQCYGDFEMFASSLAL